MAKKVLNRNVVVGIDQSATGTAVVALKDGQLIDQLFYVKTKKVATKMAKGGARLSPKVKAGDEVSQVRRLDQIRSDVDAFFRRHLPGHVAIEAHGFTAGTAHARTLAEVGGVLRLVLWRRRIPFRAYPVWVPKIFATGRGDADKSGMIAAVEEVDGVDLLRIGVDADAAGNLADAYWLADVLVTELDVRSGAIDLRHLSEHRRRVFLRTTKTHPINLLDQPFVVRED